jgi:hypothetical protein
MLGCRSEAAAALRAWIQLVVDPQIYVGVGIEFPHGWESSRIAVEYDVLDAGDPTRWKIRPIGFGPVVLHDKGAKRVSDARDACLRSAGGLLQQRTRVVRMLARWIEEQHGAHCGYSTFGAVGSGEVLLETMDRGRLSACIITYNEADRIEACLRSVSFCDEIVVIDSHSTDETRRIAASLGAAVIERDWPGYRSQKQFAVDCASSDWVLCVDADERVSVEVRGEIEALREGGFQGCAGWSVPRITDYFGRFLRHGNAYPDRLVRLFDRRRGGWSGQEIHENTRVTGRLGRLRGHLEHYSYRSLTDHFNRMARYADLMAHALHARGKRCGFGKVLVNPQWRFLRGYFIRLGFLDGWRGLVFALIEANYVRRKYLQLYMLSKALPP